MKLRNSKISQSGIWDSDMYRTNSWHVSKGGDYSMKRRDLPSQVELFPQSNGSHNSDNKSLNRLIHSHEDRAPSVNAPYLYSEGHPWCHHSLQYFHKNFSSSFHFQHPPSQAHYCTTTFVPFDNLKKHSLNIHIHEIKLPRKNKIKLEALPRLNWRDVNVSATGLVTCMNKVTLFIFKHMSPPSCVLSCLDTQKRKIVHTHLHTYKATKRHSKERLFGV